MKKILGILALISVVLVSVGCKGSGGGEKPPLEKPTYTVTFDIKDTGREELTPQSIKEGLKITEPIVHAKEKKAVEGWYTEEECNNKWNFGTDVVTKDIILYANWVEFVDKTNTGVGTMKAIVGGAFDRAGTDVTVSDFYMGETEVTQGQWEAVMGSWPGITPNICYGDGANYPAYYISWYDAVEFCNALSEDEGLEKVYTIDKVTEDLNNTNSSDTVKWTVNADFTKNGYRLPTEAEWEYVAGGGATNRTTWAGTSTDGNAENIDDLGDYAWYSGNNTGSAGDSTYGSKEVGTKKANALGLKDMSGNVWEWCWDWYGSYGNTVQTNPTGPESGSYRVRRGGDWGGYASYCQVAYRSNYFAYYRVSNDVGFRVARSCAP